MLEEKKLKEKLLNKNGDLTKEEQIKLGKAILNCSDNSIDKQIIDLSEKDSNLDAIYLCVKERGGKAIIVNANKEYLTATSSVDFERHLQEFMDGRRTNK